MDDPSAEINGARDMDPSLPEAIDLLAQAAIDALAPDDWRAILRADPPAASRAWEKVRDSVVLALRQSDEHKKKPSDPHPDPDSRGRRQVGRARGSQYGTAGDDRRPETRSESNVWDRAREETLQKLAANPFAEIGSRTSPLPRVRDRAVVLIASALERALHSSTKLTDQRSTCWRLLWQPLDAQRKLAPYPTDPLRLRRWPAFIHDVRRHVRRAVPLNRKSRDAWPPNGHPIWKEALGMLLARDDLAAATAAFRDMPSNEFAKLVKHAWLVGPRLERGDYARVLLTPAPEPKLKELEESAVLLPGVAEPEGERPFIPQIWNWSITRLKNEAELAARRSLKGKLGTKVWRILTLLPVAKRSPEFAQALADDLGTRRLPAKEKLALADAESKGLLGGPGERLRWNPTAPERTALRHVVDEVSRYGQVTDFVEEYFVRAGKPAKLRPRPDHPVRQHPELRAAMRRAYLMLGFVSPDPLGELVELVLFRISLRIAWETQDWDQAKGEEERRAARARLREMIRRQLEQPP